MRFEHIILLASMSPVFWVCNSRAASILNRTVDTTPMMSDPLENPLEMKMNRQNANLFINSDSNLATKENARLAVGGISDIVGCLGKRWNSNKDECYEMFLTFWNTYSKNDSQDNSIQESKKSKKKLWDVKNLMLGAVVKLLLFLPIFAILTGKAISLSLTSLLITSLAFLYKSQFNSFYKRSNFN